MNIGTIRRIDNLGRIVLPKSIRKALKIKSSDNLEIYIEGENIIIKKHSDLNKIKNISHIVIKFLKEKLKAAIYITDRNKIIDENIDIKTNEISEEIINIIENRKEQEIKTLKITNTLEIKGNIIVKPILVNGDTLGSIIINKKTPYIEKEKEIINTVNTLYERIIEE